MNQYHYEVGDIVKLKKQHPNPSCRRRFPFEVFGMWSSGDGNPQIGGEKHQRTS